jgi:hypothetical protein
MAGILLSRRKIHAHLKGLGFKQTRQLTTGHVQHRFWTTPWGYHFPVPDEDFVCATWDLQAILLDVEKTRPKS